MVIWALVASPVTTRSLAFANTNCLTAVAPSTMRQSCQTCNTVLGGSLRGPFWLWIRNLESAILTAQSSVAPTARPADDAAAATGAAGAAGAAPGTAVVVIAGAGGGGFATAPSAPIFSFLAAGGELPGWVCSGGVSLAGFALVCSRKQASSAPLSFSTATRPREPPHSPLTNPRRSRK